jgi:hypothetical protein
VPHRLAPLRQLDLDRLGPQLGQVRRAGRAEDVLGGGDGTDPLQDLGLMENVLRIEDAAAEILKRHVLQSFIDH